jgi:hypothetical protein
MDIVVIDVPNILGMLILRERTTTLGGILQMDLSYATILALGGGFLILRREPI